MQRSLRRGFACAALAMPLAMAGDVSVVRDIVLDVPAVPAGVVAADVDRDGRPDLIVLLRAGAEGAPRLALLRNAGEGRFAPAVPLPDLASATGASPGAVRQVVALDMDLDGDLDLVGAGFPSALWRNAGDGTFAAEPLPPEADGDHVAAGDLDGDAEPELVVARDDEASALQVLRNDGAGRFVPTAAVVAEAAWPLRHLAIADLDGDSRADVAAIADAPETSCVLRGLGGGALGFPEAATARVASLVPFGTTGRFAVADFDGDRRDDLAAAVGHPRAVVSVLFAIDATGAVGAADAGSDDAAPSPLVLLRGRISDRPGDGHDRVLVTGTLPDAALASLADPGAAHFEIAVAEGVALNNQLTRRLDVADAAGTSASKLVLVSVPGPHGGAAAPSEAHAAIDVARRRFTVSASALGFSAPPSNPVRVTLTTPAGRWSHVAVWRAPRRGELTWSPVRARAATKTADASGPATAPTPAAGFEVTTRRIGGADVQILRDRATGRAWRFDSAAGQWVPLGPDLSSDSGTLGDGLAAFLPLDHDLADRAPGRATPAIAHGGVTIANGEARFDGTGWLELPHIPLDGRAHAFSMWVRPEGAEGVMGLVEQRDANAGRRHYHLMLRGSLQPYLGFYLDDVAAPDGIARGAWHHLVFQYTGTRMEIWVDGARVASRASAAYAGTTGATRLGRNPGWTNVGGSHFVGAMRRVRVYDRSLTDAEIAALFGRERPPEAKAPAGTTFTFEGVIDGSDRVVITANEARWQNVYWGTFDTEVKLNGVAWQPRKAPVLANAGATRFLPPGTDLSRARLVSRSGRDHVSIETEPGRLILRFVDSPNGVDTYRVVVAFD